MKLNCKANRTETTTPTASQSISIHDDAPPDSSLNEDPGEGPSAIMALPSISTIAVEHDYYPMSPPKEKSAKKVSIAGITPTDLTRQCDSTMEKDNSYYVHSCRNGKVILKKKPTAENLEDKVSHLVSLLR